MNRGFTVHYAPGAGPLCGSNYPVGALTENPHRTSLAASSTWSWQPRAWPTTTNTAAAALTAAGRSPPEAEWNGGGRCAGRFPSPAVRRDGRPAARTGPELQKSGYITHLRFSEVQCLPADR